MGFYYPGDLLTYIRFALAYILDSYLRNAVLG